MDDLGAGFGRVAVTGSAGRLGRAVVAVLIDGGFDARSWTRPDYDLDDPAAAATLVDRDRPAVVIHCAAWTDVDGCARDPDLAGRRNATAVAELAQALARSGGLLLHISTNEVFDGKRTDGRSYREDDSVAPINPYGMSKLAGERAALEAFDRAEGLGRLLIVRTAWLYGPPGNDFPTKILAAADRLPPGEPLKVVADEVGSPTFTQDLASAVVTLMTRGALRGVYHLVNAGKASRLEVARAVLEVCRPGVRLEPISRSAFVRPSSPPAWAVLDGGKAASVGITMRAWPDALDDYLRGLTAGA